MGDQTDNATSLAEAEPVYQTDLVRDPFQDQSVPIFNLNEINSDNSIVNVTREYRYEYATIMFGYIMPLVLIVTLITNTLVVMVLAKKHMRTPTNIVLYTMAIVDLLTLVFPAPWYFYIYTLGFHDKFLYPPFFCYAHHVMTDVFPIFFHTSSIWLALLLASQRYIYVCHPTIANTWCTVRRVRKAIKFILIVALLHQSPKFFDNTFSAVKVREGQTVHMACKLDIAAWVQAYLNLPLYFGSYFVFRILFVFIIPCVALITLNCLLFRALRRAEDKRTKLLGARFKSLSTKRESATGVVHQYNSLHDNRYSSTVEVVSAAQPVARDSISSAGNRAPSPIIESIDAENNAQVLDHLSYRRNSNLNRQGRDGEHMRSGKNSCALTSDSKLSCQTLEEQVQMSVFFSSRPQFESQRSQESNKSCPVTSVLSKSDTVCNQAKGYNNSSSNCRQEKKLDNNIQRCHHHQNQRSICNQTEEDEDEGCIHSEKEDDSICHYCTPCYYNEELDCLRCSKLARDGASGERRAHLCQALSQCSSMTGGATNNTTTAEDGSGSVVMVMNNNTRSSSLAVTDASFQPDSALTAKSNGDDTYDRDYKQLKAAHFAPAAVTSLSSSSSQCRLKVRKSGSVDSRLACGCSSPSAARSMSVCMWRRSNCPECCDNQRLVGRNSTTRRSLIQRSSTANTSAYATTTFKSTTTNKTASNITKRLYKRSRHNVSNCSCSEPCINCNNNIRSSFRGSEDNTSMQATPIKISANKVTNSTFNQKPRETGESQTIGDTNQTECLDSVATKSAPVIGNANKAIIAAITTATTNTTATTTLQSTNANSECSLLQVMAQQGNSNQQQSRSKDGSQNQQAHLLLQQNQAIQPKKSHSIIGVPFRGRGSSNPTNVVTGGGHSISSSSAAAASMKTMDSNRTTLMLIVVVSVFLIVEVPVAFTTILHVILSSFDAFKDVEYTHQLNYMKLFTNFFIMLSYSVNFTIYCSMSKKFRDTFKDLFVFSKQARDQRLRQLLNEQQQHAAHHSQYNKHTFEQVQSEANTRPTPVGCSGSASATAAATVATSVAAPTVVPLESVVNRNRNLLRYNQRLSSITGNHQQQQQHQKQQQPQQHNHLQPQHSTQSQVIRRLDECRL